MLCLCICAILSDYFRVYNSYQFLDGGSVSINLFFLVSTVWPVLSCWQDHCNLSENYSICLTLFFLHEHTWASSLRVSLPFSPLSHLLLHSGSLCSTIGCPGICHLFPGSLIPDRLDLALCPHESQPIHFLSLFLSSTPGGWTVQHINIHSALSQTLLIMQFALFLALLSHCWNHHY